MTLKEVLLTIKYGTNVCICDELGPHNDTCPVEKLPAVSIISDLNREVECMYVDSDDMSLTIELADEDENLSD